MDIQILTLVLVCILLAVIYALPLITLSILAWRDLKTCTVKNWQLLLFALSLVPFGIFWWIGSGSLYALLISAVIITGAILLKHFNKLAAGDAYMIIPAAAAFGSDSLLLLAGSLLFTAVFFVVRKKQEGKKVPYAPGLLAAMAVLVIPNIYVILATIPAIL